MISADKSKAIQNRRVCYWCALPINDKHIQVCPRCGHSDIDDRRARPTRQEPRLINPLPHPWHRLQMREGGTVILSGNKGSGKAQPLDAKVLTPSGWKLMGELEVGDRIVDPDGGEGEVLEIFERGKRPVFTIETQSGARTRCCEDHLWLVQSYNQRRNGQYQVRSTAELLERGIQYINKSTGYNLYNWDIPLNAALQGDARVSIPMAPYLLGALIGDGTIIEGSPTISNSDSYILQRIEKESIALDPELRLAFNSGNTFRITTPKRGPYIKNSVRAALEELEIWGHNAYSKFIPSVCFQLPIEDRIDLLRGLMDTDGDIQNKGQTITFNTSSNRLALDVQRLVREMGGTAKLSKPRQTTYTYKNEKKTGAPSWRIYIKTPFCPFGCPRKVERWKEQKIRNPIVSIHPDGEETVRCIRVSTARNLYITDDYIVTHNTSICLKISPTLFISTEQEIEEVAHAWYRIMGESGVQVPIITNTYSWEQLEEDLLQLKAGDRVIVDSISQLATGPESSEVVRRVIEHVRKAGAIAVFIAQFTKDGGMLGPNMLNHMVDVVCTIPDDDLGMRRLTASKNRFGSLFAQYFTLTEKGVEEQEFPYAYSVEGSAGNYSLQMYPMKPSKFGGIFESLVEANVFIEGMASCAIRCSGYRSGFAEPSDVEWRRIFAEQHGLMWVSPEVAREKILQAQEEQENEMARRGQPREM